MTFRVKVLSLLMLLLFTGLCQAQSKNDNTIIAHFKGQTITLGEFEKAYAKSGAGSGNVEKDSLAQLKNFLNLYVEYKMKLEDGKEKGLEKDPDLIKELNTYKDQIAYTFYTDKYLIQPNIKELYKKRKWEYRASHIMFKVNSGDTVSVLKLANAVLDSLKNGADFSKMAIKYSTATYTGKKGGDLYYFSAGQLPLNIENAIIETPVGKIYPKVLRSNFGYHIIKVTEKQERVPKIRVSHILIRYSLDGKTDTAKAKAIIDTVYQKLKGGTDFGKLAHQYSMDKGSATKDGDIGFIRRNQTVRPFDEAAFKLKNVGDISGIVKSRFGYHIIKLTGKAPYPNFDEERNELIKIFKSRQYFNKYDKLADSLIAKYKLVENEPVVDYIASIADTSKDGFDIKNLSDSVKSLVLFTLPDQKFTVHDFIQMAMEQKITEAPETKGVPFKVGLKRVAGEYLIIKDATEHFKNDSSFIDIMDNYKKGIIIFKLQQDEVWDKIKLDSTNLNNYYIKNSDKYKWPDRVEFTELFTRKDSLIHHYQNLLNKGESFDTLCSKFTERPGYSARAGHWSLNDKNHNNLYQLAWSMNHKGEFSDIFKNSGGYSIIRLDKKEPARTKTFDEAKAEVSSDYQKMRTKQLQEFYVEKLNKKFRPEIDYQTFENILKKK